MSMTCTATLVLDDEGNEIRNEEGAVLFLFNDGCYGYVHVEQCVQDTNSGTVQNDKQTLESSTNVNASRHTAERETVRINNATQSSRNVNASRRTAHEQTVRINNPTLDSSTNANVDHHAPQEQSVQSDVVEEGSGAWGRTETLKLIQLYSENKERFESTTVRNHKVWLDITLQMRGRNLDQIRNRWKYLKQKYTLVKDNMSGKVTGTKKIKFEYFQEMEAIYAKEPNIDPITQDSDAEISDFPPLTPVTKDSEGSRLIV